MPRLKASYDSGGLEVGVDEAGRGCLAGPVFAAAVILPPGCRLPGLNDSKKISRRHRERLRDLIEQRSLAYKVACASVQEIDTLNILHASHLAMKRAVEQLETTPDLVLIDGHHYLGQMPHPYVCIVRGDEQYRSIAAASILAKTYRDDYMRKAHCSHPHYAWCSNKGYGTIRHRQSIQQFGVSPLHRLSFAMGPSTTPNEKGHPYQ